MMDTYKIIKSPKGWYTVYVKKWWWPFYAECDYFNVHISERDAVEYARKHAQGEKTILLGSWSEVGSRPIEENAKVPE